MKLFYFSFIFFLSVLNCSAQNKNASIKNLVFEGGGVRGLAYAGALIELEDRKLLDSVQRVAGTSAGAIAATLYAVGYTPKEILCEISNLNVKSFADGRGMFIGGIKRMKKSFGWYRGEKFHKWIGKMIKAKTQKENITFKELHELSKTNKNIKALYLTGTNLTSQRMSILSHETFPDMEVRTGVRISMSIPFYFQAVIIDKYGKVCSRKDYHKGEVMVDGGIVANFPIFLFDYQKYCDNSNDSSRISNPGTLGLRLDEELQIKYDKERKGLAPVQINRIKDFTVAFYRIVLENLNRQNLTEQDWERTISISTGGIGPRIKKMSSKDKNVLIENGRRGVREYYSIRK